MTSNIVALRRDATRKPVTELPPDGYGEVCEPGFAPDEIDSEGLRGLIRAGKPVQLLDVREGWERELGRIEPSTHVPLGRLEVSTASDIAPLDPSVQTVVYCAHGIRSLRGIRILRERHGFRSAVSLRGGMMAWSK
jgi:adenylyltransferase/sulfurtransferase